jgi:hypothetical protein
VFRFYSSRIMGLCARLYMRMSCTYGTAVYLIDFEMQEKINMSPNFARRLGYHHG